MMLAVPVEGGGAAVYMKASDSGVMGNASVVQPIMLSTSSSSFGVLLGSVASSREVRGLTLGVKVGIGLVGVIVVMY